MDTVFISHNKADKVSARLLAIALVEYGLNVWFDQWEIRPGDSVPGGIEAGLKSANTFALVWSKNAARSNWVGTEVRAYITRRVSDESLRIVPVMLDQTALPALVAEYRGFSVKEDDDFGQIAQEIAGTAPDEELVRRLQNRLLDLVESGTTDPLPYFVCPTCGSKKLKRFTQSNVHGTYYIVQCEDCSWSADTEV